MASVEYAADAPASTEAIPAPLPKLMPEVTIGTTFPGLSEDGSVKIPTGCWWVNVAIVWPGADATPHSGPGRLSFAINVPEVGLPLSDWRRILNEGKSIHIMRGFNADGAIKIHPKSAPDSFVVAFDGGVYVRSYIPSECIDGLLWETLAAADAAGYPFTREETLRGRLCAR